MPVNEGRPDYVAKLAAWRRGRDCYEGSDAVKARGEVYLPKLGWHRADTLNGQKAYDDYKLRALFYNAVARTVDGLAGGVFQKPLKVDGVDERTKGDLEDVTLTGTTLEAFALEAMKDVLKTGRYFVLVDMSERQQRPYWIAYQAEAVVNWRTAIMGGDEILTMVVLSEKVEEADPEDPFTPKMIDQFRVLQLKPAAEGSFVYTQTVWREVAVGEGKKEWREYSEQPGKDPVMVPSRRGTALPFIPGTFIGPTGTSSAIEKPPLDDLVEVNLSHYRGSADLKHGLHWAALPTPYVSGRSGDANAPLTVGSMKAWELTENGKAGYLEVEGPGFDAMRTDQQDMQKMMATLGARLLEDQPTTQETLGAVGMRHAGEHASLRTIAGAVEQAMTFALQVHAWWHGTVPMPKDTKARVELNKEFFQIKASPEVVKQALLNHQAGRISYSSFVHTLQTGEWLPPGATPESEQQAIAREGDLFTEPPPPEPDPGGGDDGAGAGE